MNIKYILLNLTIKMNIKYVLIINKKIVIICNYMDVKIRFFFPIDFLNLKTYSNFIQTLKIPCFSYQSITGSFSRFRHPRFSIFRPRRKLVISTGSPMFRLPRKDEVPLTGMVQSTVGGDNGDDDDHHIDGRKEDILNSVRC